MQKNMFEYKHSTQATLLAILAPLLTSLVISLVLSIVASISKMEPSQLTSNVPISLVTTILVELSFLVSAYILARRSKINIINATGITKKSSVGIYLLGALLAILAVIFANPIISCWENLMTALNYQSSSIPLALDNIWNLLLAILIYAIIPAICEETLFRGVVLNGLRCRGPRVAILISALIFSLMHLSWLQLPYTFILGIIFGAVYYYTKNLNLTILMHATNNAVVLLIGYLTFGQEYSVGWYWILIGIAGLALLIASAYFIIKFIKTKTVNQELLTNQTPSPLPPTPDKRQRLHLWTIPAVVVGLSFIIYSLYGFGVF